MFNDDDKCAIPAGHFPLEPPTVRQAIYCIASAMARAGGAPEDCVEQAKQVLLDLYKLGPVGRSNLLRWVSQREITDGEMKRAFASAGLERVYIMTNAAGQFKVGKARNVELRRQNLSTGAAGGLRVVAAVDCTDFKAEDVEEAAHERLEDHRIGGEWFDCDEATVLAAVEAAWSDVFGDPSIELEAQDAGGPHSMRSLGAATL